jgi:hypothetical protein
MPVTLSATFDTRREAEMTIERLVQQFDLDRAAIAITVVGEQNSAGDERAGSDDHAGDPAPAERDDAPLNGAITVTAQVRDDDMAEQVRTAFGEFDADGIHATGGPAE